MEILFDQQVDLQADTEAVWALLTHPENRKKWQHGLKSIEHTIGSKGLRGSITELTLAEMDSPIEETVTRSRSRERLQTEFRLGDCRYIQTYHLSRINPTTVRVHYYCKRDLDSGWKKILNIRPAAPTCVQPAILQSLETYTDSLAHNEVA